MTLALRITRLLLASLCVFLVFSAGPLAHSQDAPAQQDQSAQSGPQQPTGNSATAKEGDGFLISREETYYRFIRQMGRADARIQRAIAEGEKPAPITFHKDLGIGEDDYKALYIVVVDAYRQLKANEDGFVLARAGLDLTSSNVIARQESDKRWEAISRAYGQKRSEVTREVMARLKQVLTEEGFKKANAYIYRRYGGGRIEFKNNSLIPNQESPSVTPAPAKPQGVQP